MNAYYKGQPIFGPRGPAGPDGNPIGTVISFMGLTAPKDYLVCDGAEYNVADYPDLAAFFKEQFGSANHFGGDGETTFAVPDLRNLFLRGFHGEAEEQLSGEVGERQTATAIPNMIFNENDDILGYTPLKMKAEFQNIDTYAGDWCRLRYARGGGHGSDPSDGSYGWITARPVNMAVLFCIKAAESVPAENVYSTEETRIGTWIDGKPIYRKIFYIEKIGMQNTIASTSDYNIDILVNSRGILFRDGNRYILGNNTGGVDIYNHHFRLYLVVSGMEAYSAYAMYEYTKTTD